ncbi:MAG: V-type ATP synthase subunit D [Candidatus Nezhaarchaeales archaeon]
MLARIRPTKIELIRLRKRLTTSIRVQKILSDRLTILINEYMTRLREVIDKRAKVRSLSKTIYREASIILGLYGLNALMYLRGTSPKPRIYIGTENIMGVKVMTTILRYGEERLPWGFEDFVKRCRDYIKAIIDLATSEQAVEELGKEILAIKRKTNALQYIIVPRLRTAIKVLQMKFDEREREERARLKRIKRVLERRKIHG